jgi:Ca2+-binding RTX toxin-like protein
MNGLAGNDTINAGSGNAGLGYDYVYGEAGNDLLIADFSESTKALDSSVNDAGANSYDGSFINSDATHRVGFEGIERFNITGTNFTDNIFGGAGKDILNGGAGKDYIRSGGGADVINGGTGIDAIELDLSSNTNSLTINIKTANFTVAGAAVSNTERFGLLTTGSGNDIITGGRYEDVINTGDGDDTIDAGLGHNVVNAGDGDDLLIIDYSSLTTAMTHTENYYNYNGIAGYSNSGYNGSNVNDYLDFTGVERFNITGTAYGEYIYGGENKDILKGGGGDDIISTGGGGNDIVDGGIGIDKIDINLSSSNTALAINITSTNFTAGGVTVTNVEAFDTLTTGSGNDTITGGIYDDKIVSGNGNDTINAGLGQNTVTAGVGNDLLIIDYSSLNSAILDYALYDNPTGYEGKISSGTNFVDFSGVERFNITGNSDDDTIKGGKSIDILRGNAGNDDLTGGNGNDTYLIDADVDFGLDTITEIVADGDTDIIDFSSSTAAIKIDLGNTTVQTVAANVQLLIPTLAVEGVIGGNGSDNITGGIGSQKLSGGNGYDVYAIDADIHTGTDTINETATGGIDTIDLRTTTKAVTVNLSVASTQTVATGVQLVIPVIAVENVYGGAGNDNLTGNALANTLYGGGGNDTLKGSTGSDRFLFSYGALGTSSITARLGKDTMSDFVSGQDKIVLSKATFGKITSAKDTPIGGNFAMVATDALAASSSAFITYSQATKTLFYNENGNLAGLGTSGGGFANLTNTPSLVGGDFSIVA